MPPHVQPSIESILLQTQSTSTLIMDSGSPPRIPSPTQDNRPPGGTRRSGGTKTPRKVQWHDERDASTESTESPRALDEHGLDPSAFETLTDALERHQSSSPASLPRLETVLTRESTSTSSESAPQSEYPSPSHDVPGEAFIDPSETAGLPGAGTERHSVQQAQQVINAHRRGILGNWKGWHHHHHHHHTESTDASGSNKHGNSSSNRHSNGGIMRQRKKQRRKAKWRLPGSATTDTESDVEKSADSPQTPLGPPRHTGVLSACCRCTMRTTRPRRQWAHPRFGRHLTSHGHRPGFSRPHVPLLKTACAQSPVGARNRHRVSGHLAGQVQRMPQWRPSQTCGCRSHGVNRDLRTPGTVRACLARSSQAPETSLGPLRRTTQPSRLALSGRGTIFHGTPWRARCRRSRSLRPRSAGHGACILRLTRKAHRSTRRTSGRRRCHSTSRASRRRR